MEARLNSRRPIGNGRSNQLPARPLLVVSQTTPTDPSRAPPGKHVMRVHVRSVPSRIDGDAIGKIKALNWEDAKHAYADRILDLVEEQAPDLRSCILGSSFKRPMILNSIIPILSAVTACPAAIISIRTSFFDRCSAGHATKRQLGTSISAVPLHGPGREWAPAPVLCWRRCWLVARTEPMQRGQ